MIGHSWVEGLDPETPISVLRRFGIVTLAQDMTEFTVTASMPISTPSGCMTNPFTGDPSLAALTILVDDVAGRVNYLRRDRGQWTVSSELNVEFTPGAVDRLLADPDEPVVAAARPLGPAGATTLSVCTLTHRDTVIGGGTVRTMPLPGGPPELPGHSEDPVLGTPGINLARMMAVDPLPPDATTYRLAQRPDPMINNLLGIVHGGVSSAGLELVAAAAFNHDQTRPLRTASIRVNFLRPFVAGAQSHYEATPMRIGRASAIADARAVGEDGKVAVIARVTGYR